MTARADFPIFAIAHSIPIDADLMAALFELWGPGSNKALDGRSLPSSEIRARFDRQRRFGMDQSFGMFHPETVGRGKQTDEAVWLTVGLTPLLGAQLGQPEDGPAIEIDYDVLQEEHLGVYATITGGRNFDATRLDQTEAFLDACRRAVDILQASFAFGDEVGQFVATGLKDPRARAWGVTYFGPTLAQEIGDEALKSAPAASVSRDEAGGMWVSLTRLPFAPSPEKESARTAVEKHLRLRERFGQSEESHNPA